MNSLGDAFEQLRQANPVTSEGDLPSIEVSTAHKMLESIVARRSQHRGWTSRRVQFALALAVGIAGASIAAGVTITGHSAPSEHHLFRLAQPPPTVAQPLGPTGVRTSLADAAKTLGGPVVLPNSSLANSSNWGSVWERTVPGHEYDVAVTFPSAGIIVQYDRPVPYPEPPAQMYQTEASQNPDSMSVIDLNGVPALATQQNSDQLGTNFGSIEFVKGGTRVAVLGHYDEPTLENIAQSILDQ
ncbi:MAG TPA: hypothetical protein VHZ77_10495 [Gaiellaceae bacterium]|jgi:hypothetical protein|nr:hypothetical protein [Gaiellaceae bacterium]